MGWDSWMASLTQWTWVWASSGICWWTGKPGVLQSMRQQRVRHDWATELTELNWYPNKTVIKYCELPVCLVLIISLSCFIFLLILMPTCRHAQLFQSCLTLCGPMDYSPPGSSCPWDSPGKNTEVGCHALLQGIFPTQEWNPCLLHCRQILYSLRHLGSPSSILLYTIYSVYCLS